MIFKRLLVHKTVMITSRPSSTGQIIKTIEDTRSTAKIKLLPCGPRGLSDKNNALQVSWIDYSVRSSRTCLRGPPWPAVDQSRIGADSAISC